MEQIELPGNYSYKEIKSACDMLSGEYRGIIKKTVIGKSWDGREIPMLVMGTGKRCVLLTGGVHGRESVNPIVLVKMAERYSCLIQSRLKAHGICFSEWFSKNRLLIIPLLNPDGYEIALHGFSVIQNGRLNSLCRLKAESEGLPFQEWKYNGRGIDINRNFPCKSWVRSHIGDVPASERETKALLGVFQKYRPQLYLDYHSRERKIYYYRGAKENTYNERQKLLAEQLSAVTGYGLKSPCQEIEAGDRGGNTVHYASEYGNCAALTLETIQETEGFPLNINLQREVLREVWLTPFIV